MNIINKSNLQQLNKVDQLIALINIELIAATQAGKNERSFNVITYPAQTIKQVIAQLASAGYQYTEEIATGQMNAFKYHHLTIKLG